MQTEYRYIFFKKIADKPKTVVYGCYNSKSKEGLGLVKWHAQWRQYCFFPSTEYMTVFNVGCLKDICHFIEQLPRKTRSKKE